MNIANYNYNLKFELKNIHTVHLLIKNHVLRSPFMRRPTSSASVTKSTCSSARRQLLAVVERAEEYLGLSQELEEKTRTPATNRSWRRYSRRTGCTSRWSPKSFTRPAHWYIPLWFYVTNFKKKIKNNKMIYKNIKKIV